MSTIWVAPIIIAITVIPPAIFIHLSKRHEKKRHEGLLADFTTAGVKHGLSFTHQEMLKDKLFGLDVDSQILLLYSFDKTHSQAVVDLADAETCIVYGEYDQDRMSDKKDAVLTQSGLKIGLSSNVPDLMIGVYDNRVNSIHEMPELGKRQKNGKL